MEAGSVRKVTGTKVRKNGFIAEIIVSKAQNADIYHYVIQRENSAEVAHFGQEISFQRAMECIEEYLEGPHRGTKQT